MSIPHFTPKQGQYLAFLHAYLLLHQGRSPAEADFQNYFRTTPPSVHRMIVVLHQHGFIERTRDIYRYQHFICDSGGSLCEVVDPDDPNDAVLKSLSESTLLLNIEGTPEHTRTLVERFRKYPKPMYYQPKFLERKWAEYKEIRKIRNDDDVVPDDFAVWGFEQLLHHRIPLYQKIAKNFGYQVPMEEIPKIKSEIDFLNVLGANIDKR